MPNFTQFALALLLFNAAAFFAFWWDKQMAKAGSLRISERSLLLLALFGGFGAKAGQNICRHKTLKEPFRSRLDAVVVANVIAIVAISPWLAATP